MTQYEFVPDLPTLSDLAGIATLARGSRLTIFMFPRVVDDGIDWKGDGWVLPGRE